MEWVESKGDGENIGNRGGQPGKDGAGDHTTQSGDRGNIQAFAIFQNRTAQIGYAFVKNWNQYLVQPVS